MVRGLTGDVRQLVSDEVALAKAELGSTARRGAWAAGGVLLALLGAGIFLIFALVTLVEWLPNHTLVAALIAVVGLLLVLVGGATVWAHRRLWPFGKTKASLQEDLDWARRLSKRSKP